MLKELFNFKGVNWWVLLGGIGLNFILSVLVALMGTYMSQNATDSYESFGQPLMMLALFVLCGLAGFAIAKIADAYSVKHAFLSSLGAALPMLASFFMGPSIILLMMAIIAVLGNLNGAMLAVPRRRSYGPPPDRR